MKHIRPAVLVLVLTQISGCAYLTSFQGDVEHRIDILVEQKEYGKALDTLGNIKKDRSDYERLMAKYKEVVSAVEMYEKNEVLKAENLINQERWDEALNIYDRALSRLPKSKVLHAGKELLHTKQNNRLAELKTDLLIAQAEWVRNSLPVYESISKVAPHDNAKKRLLKRKQAEANELVFKLMTLGRDALMQGDLSEARRIISKALLLEPSLEGNQTVKNLEAAEVVQAQLIEQTEFKRRLLAGQAENEWAETTGQAKTEEEEKRNLAQQLQEKELLNAYEQAFFDKKLKEAKEVINKLEALDNSNIEYRRRRSELEQVIKNTIEQYVEEGTLLYSQAHFREAITTWQKVLEIEPENKLVQSHIDRANLALDNLQRLREKQMGTGQTP